MEFEFQVGSQERHHVRYSFDKTWGRWSISVDGKQIKGGRHLFSVTPTRRYRFTVGEAERHDVVIEKTRKMVAAGVRPMVCRVFVDGTPAGVFEG